MSKFLIGLLLIGLIIVSCGKESTSTGTTGLLSKTWNLEFIYTSDTLPSQIIYTPGTYTGGYPDTTFSNMIYDNSGKLVRIITLGKNSRPGKYKKAIYFNYQDGLLTKILFRREVFEYNYPQIYNSDFTSSYPDDENDRIDSLVYENRKLKAKYTVRGYKRDFKLYYKNSDPNLLEKIVTYSYGSDKDSIYSMEYDMGKRNPLYYTCKELAFIGSTISDLHTIPSVDSRNSLQNFTCLNPYMLKEAVTISTGAYGWNYFLYKFKNDYDPATGRVTLTYVDNPFNVINGIGFIYK